MSSSALASVAWAHFGQGSGVWGIEVDVSVTAYDGSWAQAQVLSGDVNF